MTKEIKTLLVKKLDKNKDKYFILDVRTPKEYDSEHIVGSVNIPLDYIEKYLDTIKHQKKEIAIICRSGNRSEIACKKLHSVEHTLSIEGGIVAWKQHGFKTKKGKSIWDLERQVRFVAGLLVFLGVLLHFLVAKQFIYLSGFVSLGLMFASLTNTCAMGMFISKMPWNNSNKWKQIADNLN
jgi:rhodanese-related sulfurtransferase